MRIRPEVINILRAQFEQAAASMDGELDVVELRNLSCFRGVSEAEIQNIFSILDTDNSGKVAFQAL